MKKVLLYSVLFLTLILVACSDSDQADTAGKQNEGKNETKTEEQENAEVGGEMEPLKLQMQKGDEEAGVTLENSGIYSALAEAVEAEPQMGLPNDFSLYPFDISENEDGSSSLIFLAINRIQDGMQNVSFNLTMGNQDGEYIFQDVEIYMPEEQFGIIEPDSSVPFLIDITPEEEELYLTLDMDNIHWEITNFEMETVE